MTTETSGLPAGPTTSTTEHRPSSVMHLAAGFRPRDGFARYLHHQVHEDEVNVLGDLHVVEIRVHAVVTNLAQLAAHVAANPHGDIAFLLRVLDRLQHVLGVAAARNPDDQVTRFEEAKQKGNITVGIC